MAIATLAVLVAAADSRSQAILLNTAWLVVGTLSICIPLGVVLGLLLSRTDLPVRRSLSTSLVALVLIPLYLQAAAWQAGFGLSGWYTTFALSDQPLLSGWRAVIWIHACAAIPWVALFVGLAARKVDRSLEESALLDMAPPAVFRRITLRQIAPAVVLAGVWVAVQATGEMTVTDFYGIRTYAEEVYTDLNLGRWTAIDERAGSDSSSPRVPAAAGIAIVCLLVAASLWLAVKLATEPLRVETRTPLAFKLGSSRWPLALLMLEIVAFFVALPLANLVYKAGVQVTEAGGGYTRYWSSSKFLSMLANAPRDHREEFGWSITIAALAATLVVAAAIALAWLARTNRGVALITFTLAVLALATPGPLVGLALINVFNSSNAPPLNYLYDHTIAAPVLAQSFRAFPLGLFIIWHSLRTLPQPLLDAAALDCGPLRQLALAIRLRISPIALAWLAAFVVAFGDLAATILVVPPGVTTLPVHIFGLLHYNVEDQVAAISLLLIALHSAAAIVLLSFGRRSLRLGQPAAVN